MQKPPPKPASHRSLLILAYLIYILSPIDLITDVIPIAGWIDDAVVASLLAAEVAALVQDRRTEREVVAKGESTDEC